MNPSSIGIIKSTAPLIKEKGFEITMRMYEIAFSERPEYRRFFVNTWMSAPEAAKSQAERLASAIYLYAANIDNLGKLDGPVQHIAKAHVATNIVAENYVVIGECLIAAIKDVLGDTATPEVLAAWTEAYFNLADIFISVEKDLYKKEDEGLFDIKKAYVG
ncbi:MAG: bacitracin resistance protein BacA [Gammaproteobacteria bacterium]|mgnify:FL=1|jgi:nitric oxide dioxygenase|nr:bacitracin resistance protein BacA [Gammaproteobacteria bacterium]MBT5156068.1 bacitracin resistance protein BacA [Gammaproteobacteria bacterium]MBT5686148.1 bacitracin resistance protein BacA [Gammaproteobacteria bacterium]MBT5724960.1 bacitracin resistance protein BacA [Gammaproteobacteria bacterium]MBT6583540.1 bacitracin resistance protein BacA [Gammaproteobacteria bacterium]